MCHKLVQPGAIWCLLYEGSISVITKHYTAICLALEAVDKHNDADGLLLIFRKTTSYFLGVISSVKLSQGDLRLCRECEIFHYPEVQVLSSVSTSDLSQIVTVNSKLDVTSIIVREVYISPYCQLALVPPNFMKFRIRGQLIDLITRVKCGHSCSILQQPSAWNVHMMPATKQIFINTVLVML